MIGRRALLLAALNPSPAINGRWNLKPEKEPRGRAWWLKIENAGTPQMRGEFVGFPGGQLDKIPQLQFNNDVLTWQFKDRAYRATATNNNTIKGEMKVGTETVKFTGMRAPELKEKDDGTWRPTQAVELFNGKDLTGWIPNVPTEKMNWYVENGILKNGQKAINIGSTAKFFNFKLHVEFRVANNSNGGLGLRGRYEIQIFGDHGQPTSVHGNGALYSRVPPAVNATRPPDEWQTYDITLIGRDLTVILNGKTLHSKLQVEGLTAMATDPDESAPGPLNLQGDHGPVEFRKITISELKSDKR